MHEFALPDGIRRRASVTPGGEHAWQMRDVEEAIAAGRDAGLACLGGQIQFRLPAGTYEAYWINYDSSDRRFGEPWPVYVVRAANETLAAFRERCQETDFLAVAREWDDLRSKMERESYDPIDDLWFVLYFDREPTS